MFSSTTISRMSQSVRTSKQFFQELTIHNRNRDRIPEIVAVWKGGLDRMEKARINNDTSHPLKLQFFFSRKVEVIPLEGTTLSLNLLDRVALPEVSYLAAEFLVEEISFEKFRKNAEGHFTVNVDLWKFTDLELTQKNGNLHLEGHYEKENGRSLTSPSLYFNTQWKSLGEENIEVEFSDGKREKRDYSFSGKQPNKIRKISVKVPTKEGSITVILTNRYLLSRSNSSAFQEVS